MVDQHGLVLSDASGHRRTLAEPVVTLGQLDVHAMGLVAWFTL
jgi:hypothetical protein